MEFVRAWRLVRHQRAVLTALVTVALIAALSTAYKLPSMKKRSLALGAATSQILVDSSKSSLVTGATAEQLSTFGVRARVYAQYLSSRDAIGRLSAATGIPSTLITARGPFSSGTGIRNYQQQSGESRAKDLVD